MSNIIRKTLLIAVVFATSQAMADIPSGDVQTDCAALSTSPSVSSCANITSVQNALNKYKPPQACVDTQQLDVFSLGTAAACVSSGGTPTSGTPNNAFTGGGTSNNDQANSPSGSGGGTDTSNFQLQ